MKSFPRKPKFKKISIHIVWSFLILATPQAYAGMGAFDSGDESEVGIETKQMPEAEVEPKPAPQLVKTPQQIIDPLSQNIEASLAKKANNTMLFANDTGEGIKIKQIAEGVFNVYYCSPIQGCKLLNSQPVQASELREYHDYRLQEIFNNLIAKRVPIAPGTVESLDFFDGKTWEYLASGAQGPALIDSSYNMHAVLGQLESFLHEYGKSSSDRNSSSDFLALRECSETLLFWTNQMQTGAPRNDEEKSQILELQAKLSNPSALFHAMENAVKQASHLQGFQGDPRVLLVECNQALAEAQVAVSDTLSQVKSAHDSGAKVPYQLYRALNDSNTWLSTARQTLESDAQSADEGLDASISAQ